MNLRFPVIWLLLMALSSSPQAAPIPAGSGFEAFIAPDLDALERVADSGGRPWVERFLADRATLEHVRALGDERSDPLYAPRREAFLAAQANSWESTLAALPLASLDQDERLDRLLLRRHLALEERRRHFERERAQAIAPLLPGYANLVALFERRRDLHQAEGRPSADLLDRVAADLARRGEELRRTNAAGATGIAPSLALRAARHADALRAALSDWHEHQSGFDPEFGWWVDAPQQALDQGLEAHAKFLREKLGGAADPESLHADPIGDEAILAALRIEGVDYSPSELMAAARRELAWCRAEMQQAAQAMGADDWRDALERVKQRHLAPGGQPALVVELADEAIDFLEQRDLISIPASARRGWRMNMLSPQWQLQAPFFLGGRDVWVAFPAASMPHERKLNALRGNNRHFSRAVVHHELIPGHHLQHWYAKRHNPHRSALGSPFWLEGWALYWELRLYDLGFAPQPEDRIGMLFWRSHRAARILFSLGLQSGRMSPEEAVRMLIEEVGHEPENARAEVRRSIGGDYDPLYQVAYLVGGWQFRALHHEFVVEGGWSERAFHDRVLREGSMPITLLRERLHERVGDEAPVGPWRFLESPANASVW